MTLGFTFLRSGSSVPNSVYQMIEEITVTVFEHLKANSCPQIENVFKISGFLFAKALQKWIRQRKELDVNDATILISLVKSLQVRITVC